MIIIFILKMMTEKINEKESLNKRVEFHLVKIFSIYFKNIALKDKILP